MMADQKSVIGSWRANLSSPKQGEFPALLSFIDGGVLISTEAPNGNLSSYHGAWALHDDSRLEFTFVGLFGTKAGVYAGELKVNSTLKLNPSDGAWVGSYVAVATLPNGSVNYTDKGISALKRISIEPLA
ncbi:MAG TPA: hypothetical protein VGK87_04195 [Anaerolineae bacterium]|jgi:hypothetical protein